MFKPAFFFKGGFMTGVYKKEWALLESELNEKSVMVLATSFGGRVTARSISVIYNEGFIYFQTDRNMEKCCQLEKNPLVALTTGALQIEGVASVTGVWDDHPELMALFIEKHRNSYETYKNVPTEVVIKVKISRVKKWTYMEGEPWELEILTEKEQALYRKYSLT